MQQKNARQDDKERKKSRAAPLDGFSCARPRARRRGTRHFEVFRKTPGGLGLLQHGAKAVTQSTRDYFGCFISLPLLR